ncbi:hypothetical protein CHIBITOTORO_00310 [Serratia phage vB_SmaM-ChibiTotoro]|nr:hypothetical protein CHIBITOTORO_00310 [Serratia phage vB_SmaM-ChibiTotoro]
MKRITAIAIAAAAIIGSSYVGTTSAAERNASQFCVAQGYARTAIVLSVEKHKQADRDRLVIMATGACEMGRLAFTPELLSDALRSINNDDGRLSAFTQSQMEGALADGNSRVYQNADQMKAERDQ